jgi:hypothetical protein
MKSKFEALNFHRCHKPDELNFVFAPEIMNCDLKEVNLEEADVPKIFKKTELLTLVALTCPHLVVGFFPTAE